MVWTAEPYHPGMTRYGVHNIDAYIKTCQKWTKIEIDEFDLDSGEHVIKKTLIKNFGSSDHYISLTQTFVDGVLLSSYSSLRQTNSSSSGEYGYCPKRTRAEQDVLDKVHKFTRNRRRVNEVKPALEQFFSADHSFPRDSHDSDFTIEVDDFVAFGNFFDIKNAKSQPSFLVRQFVPGQYVATMISPFEGCDPLAIFHHISIDPSKIVRQIIRMSEDYCDYHRGLKNSINRYDWCEDSYQSSSEDESDEYYDDEKDDDDEMENLDGAFAAQSSAIDSSSMRLDKKWRTIFFANAKFSDTFATSVRSGLAEQSQEVPELFKVNNANHNCIALGIDTNVNNSGDWVYGKAFQDRRTKKLFVLVANCCMGNLDSHHGDIPLEVKNKFPRVKFTSVMKTGLVFNINQFKLNQ